MASLYSQKFLQCHAVTAVWEGGWSDNLKDPGGKTMGGVTQARYDEWRDSQKQPRRSVALITRDEALMIFFTGYWLGNPSCERLFPGVDLATYDASVNSGPVRGRAWLLAALDAKNDHVKTIKALCSRRLGFVQSLKSLWQSFGRGWTNRIADIQAKSVARALAAMALDAASVQQRLDDEAAAARATAKKQAIGAAGSGTGGAAAVVVDPVTHPPVPADRITDQAPQLADWLATGLGLCLFALACWLIWRAFVNRQQATAFARASEASHGA